MIKYLFSKIFSKRGVTKTLRKNISKFIACVIISIVMMNSFCLGVVAQGSTQQDNTPIIYLNGEKDVRLSVGDNYQDAGATVIDSVYEEDITQNLVVAGLPIDTNMIGVYEISYDAADSLGNAAQQVIRNVIVAPNSVEIEGSSDGSLTINVSGVEAGAELNLYENQGELIQTGVADQTGNYQFAEVALGTGYYVTQIVDGVESNPSERVDVTSTVSPNPVEIEGSSDGSLTINVSGAEAGAELNLYENQGELIQTGVADQTGNYKFTQIPLGTGYYVTQIVDGVESNPSEIVGVTLYEKPMITLKGEELVTLYVGDHYSDAGASAYDSVFGDIPDSIIVTGLPIDTAKAGTYTIAYNVTNMDGVSAEEVTRRVVVSESSISKPTISINGKKLVRLPAGDHYTDAGATAIDPEYGEISDRIEVTGLPVNTDKVGIHTIKYNVINSDGVGAEQVTRNVIVSNPSGVEASYRNSFKLKADGTVVAWGPNDFGQNDIPKGLKEVVELKSSGNSIIALKSDGTIAAWGQGLTAPESLKDVVSIELGNQILALKSDGKLEYYDHDGHVEGDMPAELDDVIAISAGAQHYLALKSDGTVVGWGENDYGQCTVPEGLTDVVAISAGDIYSVALKSDGKVVAWGENDYGPFKVPEGLTDVVAISAGTNHCLALKADGTVVNLGDNYYGELEVPDGLVDVVDISAGGHHSLALKSDGTVVAWGDNIEGACDVPFEPIISLKGEKIVKLNLGDSYVDAGAIAIDPIFGDLSNIISVSGLPLDTKKPGIYTITYNVTNPDGLSAQEVRRAVVVSPAIKIEAGGNHSLALKLDKTVVAWGDNSYGQCDIPEELGKAIVISAGGNYSLGLKSDKTVVAWGENDKGQCDIPEDLTDVADISAGGKHSLALKSDGTAVAWGDNSNGQVDIPEGLIDVVEISAGGNHSLALKSDGTVVAWGDNANGQVDIPEGLADVVAISAGGSHSLALKLDGTVVAWGDNYYGQCIVGHINLSDEEHAVSISAGLSHTLVGVSIRNGMVVGVGRHPGDAVPIDLTDVIGVSAGGSHSLALKSDGTIVAWGDSRYGQCDIPEELKNTIELSLKGEKLVKLLVGENYVDAGAIATDLVYGDISDRIEVSGLPINNYELGKKTITYTLNDKGNTYTIERTVFITKPLDIASGYRFVAKLKDDGTVRVVGDIKTSQYNDIKKIEAGRKHLMMLRKNGEVVVVGTDHVDEKLLNVPSNLTDVIDIHATPNDCIAIRANGDIVNWGSTKGDILFNGGAVSKKIENVDNYLITDDFLYNNKLTTSEGSDIPVTKIVMAEGNCILTENGDVYRVSLRWGGSKYHMNYFKIMSNIDSISYSKKITAYSYISDSEDILLALTKDGKIISRSNNNTFGQSNIPIELKDQEIVSIKATKNENYALDTKGRIYEWGHVKPDLLFDEKFSHMVYSLDGIGEGTDTTNKSPNFKIAYGHGGYTIKYAEGDKALSYFKRNGTKITNKYTFTDLSVGTHTIYVMDKERNTRLIQFDVKGEQ